MKKSKQKAIINFHKKGWKVSEISYQLKVSENEIKQIIKDSK